MLFSCVLLRLPLWPSAFTKLKSFACVSLLILLVCPTAWAAAPYTLAHIQAERRELESLSSENREMAIQELDKRIAAVIAQIGGALSAESTHPAA